MVSSSIVSFAIMAIGAWKCRFTGEREFLYGRRWPSRTLALEEAEDQKTAYLRKGGVLIA
jgi:hypothetical protein